MKYLESPVSLSTPRRRGVALVLVLGFLVLISALIVAFFGSVTTELSSANSYAAGVTTKQLADTATNMVIGEITDATQGFKDVTQPSNGNQLAWASQPGMIRTYDQAGLPYRYYKLYSAANMVMANPTSPLTTPQAGSNPMSKEFLSDLPTDWSTHPGLFADLNAPVLVPDPNGTIVSNGFNYRADYPVVDYAAMATGTATGWPPTSPGMIEGFQVSNPGWAGSGPNASKPTSSPGANPVPMPCRWLYVLKDGTVLNPAAETNGRVTFGSGTLQPSLTNPIVGRIAFWTDDETCKVNLNTSGEGTFWDQPRGTQAGYEANLGTNIPGQNEFQRFAGHPAMTCLSTVFENLGNYWANPTTYPTNTTTLQNYLSFAPRLAYGGSQGGTAVPSATTGITVDRDRLFASPDEMAFDTHYNGSGLPTRVLDSNLNRADVEKLKFFVTASSRAPEVNLFNKPRIGLWPIQAQTNYRNPKDQLLAFCTSTGTGTSAIPYYFQRQSVYYPSPQGTYDGRLTFRSDTPSSQSTWEDFALSSTTGAIATASNSRNALLYAYLRSLTSMSVPGFGGNFQTKYDTPAMTIAGYSDRDQILTEMYDMIRAGINSYNTSVAPNYDYAPTRVGAPAPGETQLVPAVIGPAGSGWQNRDLISIDNAYPLNYNPGVTKGFGRFNTVQEVAIVFYSNGYVDTNKNGKQDVGEPTVVQAAIILDPFNPSPGLASWSPNVRCAITGLGQFSIIDKANGTQPLFLPDTDKNQRMPWNFTTARVGYVDGNHNMSIEGLLTQFHYFQSSPDPAKVVGNDGLEGTYPFASQAPALAPYAGPLVVGPTMEFSGGTIKIQIFAGYEAVTKNPQSLVQTLMVTFPKISATPSPGYPAATLPVPTISADNFSARMANGRLIENGVTGTQVTGWSNDADLPDGDVVRSMKITSDSPTGAGANARSPIMGDLRIVAALDVVPQQSFSPHASYFTSSRRAAHSLRNGGPNYLPGAQLAGAVAGQYHPTLVKGAYWSPDPSVPAGQVSAQASYGAVGDFDNNMGGNEDGPYVNKPDEGNAATGAGTYFGRGGFNVENGATYSPNRQVSSAVMFGSLPSGVKSTEYALTHNQLGNPAGGSPWQTLLFCPNPAGGTTHPGFGKSVAGPGVHIPPYQTPPDHLFLDLFTMPIVEPYAISEPFSTAGKVNLNYQIAPFTYITRSTAVRAVMKSTKVLAIKTSDLNKSQATRYNILMDSNQNGTLVGFENVFNRGDLFRSPSQICDIFLVPSGGGGAYSSMASWWTPYLHTGDNSREYPYGHIYPRVTTKSNTFTVHMRVQTLRKTGNRDKTAAQAAAVYWDNSKDQVVGEYRGSTTIERYIDLPASGSTSGILPDFASSSAVSNPTPATILDSYYKFRIVSSKRFAP